MKFEQELQENIYEPWRLEYVAYNDIKQDIKKRQEEHKWNNNDEKDFAAALRLEVDKVDIFINRKQKEIESRIAYCERTLRSQQNKDIPFPVPQNLYDTTDDTLIEILMDLNDLSKFTRYNFLALQKLVKKHDEYTKYNAQPLFLDMIRSKSFDRQRFDVLLVKISALHDLCMLHGKRRTASIPASLNQNNEFECPTTARYWVHPDNITELKAILLFHLPVLIPDTNKPVEPEDSAVSSLYFDNSNFDLYQERLQRDEGAEEIRFRWYGKMDTRSIFIERKTHHASWSNGASVKDRVCLDVDKVNHFISGTYTAQQYAQDLRTKGLSEEEMKANYFIASGIQKSIIERELHPVMRVFYNRTTFQIPGDERICISLDTELTFVREDGLQERRKGLWRRPDMGIDYPFHHLNSADVSRFPFAVLEVKLSGTQRGQEAPQWLTRLLGSQLMYEIPRFSKYLQGASLFWRPHLPLLPWWLDQLDLDIRHAKQPTGHFSGLSRSKSLKPLIDGKYRIGYLESQLERSSVLKRLERPKRDGSLTRMLSTRSMRSTKMPRGIESDTTSASAFADGTHLKRSSTTGNARNYFLSPFDSNRSSPVSVIDINKNGNPFADPIWSNSGSSPNSSITFNSTDIHMNGGVITRNRTNLSDGRRTTEFNDTSSIELLIGDKDTSSYTTDKKNHKDKMGEEVRFNVYFSEDVRALEEGAEEGEKKKKKKKKGKEGGDGGGSRIEPKIFFANERTFIHWLHFATIILTVALTLLNFGDGINRIVGAVFFGIAFLFSIYGFGFYRWRGHRISTKPHLRYDDSIGPIFLCILLVGSLVLNFALRFNSAEQNNNYLGINNTATATTDTATATATTATATNMVTATAMTTATDIVTEMGTTTDIATALDTETNTDTDIDADIDTGIDTDTGVDADIDADIDTNDLL